MQALVFDGKLRFVQNYPDPQPSSGQVLIKVHLAGICATDLEIVRGYMNFRGVLGHEFVGRVLAGPSKWLGKSVVAGINCVCGRCNMCASGLANHCRDRTVLGIARRDGAFGQFVLVPEQNLHALPDNITDQEATFVEPLAAALEITSQIAFDRRMRVTVLGPGKLGLLVGQVIALQGCKLQVVGRTDLSLQFAQKRGIQTCKLDQLVRANDQDVVIDCTGRPEGVDLALGLVRPRGTIVLKSTYHGSEGINLTPAVVNEVTIIGSRCGPFGQAISLLGQKKIEVLTMISKQFPISQGLEAFEYARTPGVLKVLLNVSGKMT